MKFRTSFFCLVVFAAPSLGIAQDQAELLARGDYLVNGVGACGNCHTQRGPDLFAKSDMSLAGGYRFPLSGVGMIFSKNITPDKETGLGSWTEQQVIRAIREGLTKEGSLIGPPMPVGYFNKISDDDVKAIAVYLRTVKPIRNEVQESKYEIELEATPAAKGLPAPPKSDNVAYGQYLAQIAHCAECHTPAIKGVTRDYENRFMAGGYRFVIGGKPVFSRNITSDPETGIGSWTDDQVKRAISEGIDKTGKKLTPQMPYPYFAKMTSGDLDSIVAYLRTVKPVKNFVEPSKPLEEFLKP